MLHVTLRLAKILVCHYIHISYMYVCVYVCAERKDTRSRESGGKEKWSASRVLKVVSFANETNIRADRVDKG